LHSFNLPNVRARRIAHLPLFSWRELRLSLSIVLFGDMRTLDRKRLPVNLALWSDMKGETKAAPNGAFLDIIGKNARFTLTQPGQGALDGQSIAIKGAVASRVDEES
jgi:hypothetical protein